MRQFINQGEINLPKNGQKSDIIVVSACLAGLNTRYDGMNKGVNWIIELVKKGKAIPLCPEVLGGLSVPRPRSTITGNRVINEIGEDVTDNFRRGAFIFIEIVKILKPKSIVLKEGSPSCGLRFTNINWKREKGAGVTTRLLLKKSYILKSID